MRILHIALSMSIFNGGPPRVIQGLSEKLIKKGAEVSILTSFKKNDEKYLILPKGVVVKRIKESFLSSIWKGHSFHFKKILEKEIPQFDIVHIHEPWHYPHFIAYHIAKKFNKPFLITPHGALESYCLNYKSFKKKIFSALVQKKALKESSFVHAITKNEVNSIKNFGVKNDSIKMVFNGIDLEQFQNLPSKESLLSFFPQFKNKKIILFLGRIHPKKGLDILARAFGKIARGRDDVGLLVVGPDSNGYQKKVEEILEKEKVLKKVVFTGILDGDKKLSALSCSDFCVIPSYSEGRSIVALEAMACGLPVIITKECDFPEIADHNAGLAINADFNELASAIFELLKSPDTVKKMGLNGKKLVKEFSWDKTADEMMDLYKSAIKDKMDN